MKQIRVARVGGMRSEYFWCRVSFWGRETFCKLTVCSQIRPCVCTDLHLGAMRFTFMAQNKSGQKAALTLHVHPASLDLGYEHDGSPPGFSPTSACSCTGKFLHKCESPFHIHIGRNMGLPTWDPCGGLA